MRERVLSVLSALSHESGHELDCVQRCLKVLKVLARFFLSFFEASLRYCLEELRR